MDEITPDLPSQEKSANRDQVVQDIGYLLARWWLEKEHGHGDRNNPASHGPAVKRN